MTREALCTQLQADPTLHHIFDLLCRDESAVAALWLADGCEKSYTFGELRQNVGRCAHKIETQQIGQRNEWIGLAVSTAPNWPVLFWGLVAAGRKPLLIDAALSDEGIRHLMREAGARALIADRPRPGVYAVQRTPSELLDDRNAPFAWPEGEWADELAFCTSGTTQTSRVYTYRGRALATQAIGIIHQQSMNSIARESRGPMRTLCFLPLSHVFGFMTNMVWTWLLEYPQVFVRDRAPETLLSTCRTLRVQLIMTVPLLINNVSTTLKKRLAKESLGKRFLFRQLRGLALTAQRIHSEWGLKLSRRLFRKINASLFGDSLEMIVSGGSHVPAEHLLTLNALGYAVICGFGMTETAVTSAECMIDLKTRLSGSVGWPFRISQYKVIPDGPDPKRGELWIQCDAMHSGRLCEGQEQPPQLNEEGWFPTGDVVRIGKKGRMWVVGRLKDVIVGESGENVYPDELEDVFAELSGTEQICVLATDPKNDTENERTTLVVNVGDRYEDASFLSDLYWRVQARNQTLPPYKKVRWILATPEPLPLAAGIKVKRNELRARIRDHRIAYRELSGSVSVEAAKIEAVAPVVTHESDDIDARVRACFAEVLEMDPDAIAPTADFAADLGGDSLQSIAIFARLEDTFHMEIPEADFRRCATMEDAAQLIRSLQNGRFTPAAAPVRNRELRPIVRIEDMPEIRAFQTRLESLDKLERNPYFVCHESPLRDVSQMDGKTVLNFGSYNYVGMSGRREVNDAAIAAVEKYGTSASGSRLLGGEKEVHEALEREIAVWKHTEDAVVLVGGHSTNVTLVGNFCGENDLILYDVIAHNSIAEGCRLSAADAKPFPHNDVKALEGILRMYRNRYAKVLIVIEGVYSMDGDIAPVPEIVELKKQYGCFLLVDEAHSACVLGPTGGGVDEYFHLAPDDVDLKMGTLSKGPGTCGGYIAGKALLISYFRYSLPGFVFSVGISPVLAAASLAAIRLMRTHPEILTQLHENIDTFIREARVRNLNTGLAGHTAIVPILVGDDDDAFALSVALGDHGVFVPPAVWPAVPRGKARLRFCVTSEHRPEQIVQALDTLVETAKAMGIALPAAEPRNTMESR